jgi:thymidylate kinase
MAGFHGWNRLPQARYNDGQETRLEQPTRPSAIAHCSAALQPTQPENPFDLYRIVSKTNVIVIEGVSGSGKDTFQAYLKKMLKNREVYDYSEGELLQSWKQVHIQGVLELRVKFMELFVSYMRDVIDRHVNAVFLLNRFHLSTYVYTISRELKLKREYNEVIHLLKDLPVHVFVLLLDEKEIAHRNLHPERADAWRNHQKQIVDKEGFQNTVGRHIWQQKQILAAVKKQEIPYSLLKVNRAPGLGCQWIRVDDASRWNLLRKQITGNGESDSKKTRQGSLQVEEAI